MLWYFEHRRTDDIFSCHFVHFVVGSYYICTVPRFWSLGRKYFFDNDNEILKKMPVSDETDRLRWALSILVIASLTFNIFKLILLRPFEWSLKSAMWWFLLRLFGNTLFRWTHNCDTYYVLRPGISFQFGKCKYISHQCNFSIFQSFSVCRIVFIVYEGSHISTEVSRRLYLFVFCFFLLSRAFFSSS